MTYSLHIACNDYRNGGFMHKAESIELLDADGSIGLQLVGDRPVSILVDQSANSGKPRYLKIGHIVLRLLGYRTWVGNWCWDDARVSDADVAKAVNYLRKRSWRCEGGYVELSDKYESGHLFVADDFVE